MTIEDNHDLFEFLLHREIEAADTNDELWSNAETTREAKLQNHLARILAAYDGRWEDLQAHRQYADLGKTQTSH